MDRQPAETPPPSPWFGQVPDINGFFIWKASLTFLCPIQRAAKGPDRSGGTQPEDIFFWLALAGGVCALWVN